MSPSAFIAGYQSNAIVDNSKIGIAD